MRKDAAVPISAGRTIRHHPGHFLRTAHRRNSYGEIAAADHAAVTPCKPASSVTKRAFDVIVSICALLILLPSFLAIALLIKVTSRGPIMFRQWRYGLNNDTFMIYKFRTMYLSESDQTGVRQTRKADVRLTPIGAVLRRFSLDELPQLFNVIRGEMSLVGPRPHVPGMLAAGVRYEVLVPHYFNRHRVKPGLTGLAQSRGFRGSTENADLAKARIELDLHYIERWSLALDLRIIINTLWMELINAGKGI
jgi:lipopolysaccharide/colanic/teichoic acid biosynthesis glycosyltransferase